LPVAHGTATVIGAHHPLERVAGAGLASHEHLYVDGVGEVIAGSDELCFGGALGVDTLLFRFANESAAPKRDNDAGVAARVVVDCERRPESQFEVDHSVQEFEQALEFALILFIGRAHSAA
jgi:hypothetical protein